MRVAPLLSALSCASLAASALLLASQEPARSQDAPPEVPLARGGPGSDGCLVCHEGIEDMHPGQELSCVDCHGGNADTLEKLAAHVQPPEGAGRDERVAPLDENLSWRRFRNPMDLRVAELVCGSCHEDAARDMIHSLHGTTAGHLSDGYYEMGLVDEKKSRYGIWNVVERKVESGDVEDLVQVPPFDNRGARDQLSTHYTDLARKECMQCHLWSEGRAVRGRVGFDGDYRGEGCAACHVSYALDGLSESSDRAALRSEPGHPKRHTLTRAPTTQTCTTCHYGDASIGLHFRGLSQLPPGAPGGPEIDGTTDTPLNRVFYLDDPELVPPDVHHQRGMHCIDCHTQNDVMGDGRLYGAMEHAVEISCTDCHGTFTEPAKLVTERGTPHDHLERRGEEVYLRSKVDGKIHKVVQVVHVLDKTRPEYNPRAVAAMTGDHGRLECYTCHAGWNVNFLGFHFDRNESLTQLDLLTGGRTPGRVTTQEKVFATWKSFYAGWNESGRVAPYLTGFSTMGTVRDEEGAVILDQEMPVTAAGLSGLTMVHHQLHSTRPTARSCIECHRSSATWGLGSNNFRLGRQLAFVADRRGLEVLAINRTQLSTSAPLAKVVLPDIVDLELECDPLQGRAERLFVSEGGRGVHVLDVSRPSEPKRVEFVATIQPRGLALAGDHLYLADGIGGLRIFDVTRKSGLEQVGHVPTFDAHAVDVQWPYAYVADGIGGLQILDVRAPIAPRVIGGMHVGRTEGSVDDIRQVEVLFQYSRPREQRGAPMDARTPARLLCAVLDHKDGLVLIDVTEPTQPNRLYPRALRTQSQPEISWRGLALLSHVDLAEPQGGTRTTERDYAYLLQERVLGDGQQRSAVVVLDVTEPTRPRQVGVAPAGFSTEMLVPASFYNPPFLQTVLFSPGSLGVLATDVTVSAEPGQLGAVSALRGAYAIAVEEFPLDRMRDESGRPLKDVSHAGSRWLNLAEIGRVLGVSGDRLGTLDEHAFRTAIPGETARLTLMELDADRSGLLEGDEVRGAQAAAVDVDEDGRIALAELARAAGLTGERNATEAQARPVVGTRMTRSDPDGDLARLLDGLNPYEFDEDDDDKLSPKELERAFFVALDLDGDSKLTLDELSRYPGELRQMRYRDARARTLWSGVDRNRNGTVNAREFRLGDSEWEAIDVDRDGSCQLPVNVPVYWERRGYVGAQSEWPTRRAERSGLPPTVTVDRIFAVFDQNGDDVLTSKELRRRPDLMQEFDRDGSERVDRREVEVRVAVVDRLGVDASADAAVPRWDLDGDGAIGPDELPEEALRAFGRGRSRR